MYPTISCPFRGPKRKNLTTLIQTLFGLFFFAIGIKVLEVSNPILLGYLKNVLNVGKE
jgi:hypothetical protein